MSEGAQGVAGAQLWVAQGWEVTAGNPELKPPYSARRLGPALTHQPSRTAPEPPGVQAQICIL